MQFWRWPRRRRLSPATKGNLGEALTSRRQRRAGDLRPIVLLAWAAVALILLMACANVSNLLLAQAAARYDTALSPALILLES